MYSNLRIGFKPSLRHGCCRSVFVRTAVFWLLSFGSVSLLHAQQTNESSNSSANQSDESSGAADSDYVLTAKPISCVALHKGQRCFIRVTLRWNVPDNQEYCLFNEYEPDPLVCSSVASGRFVTAYASDSSIQFELRAADDNTLVASATVNTSWVYRTGRRSSSSWRLF